MPLLHKLNSLARAACVLVALAGAWAAPGAHAQATCNPLTLGLLYPMGVALTEHGRLLVAEAGRLAPNSGRLTIVEEDGRQRTLLDGLPSGVADVGDASGPSDLLLRGRTAYLLIGVGDVGVMGTSASGVPVRGSTVPNPNGPSSPLLSSILAVHVNAEAERASKGFMLTSYDHQRLAAGETVTLSNGGGDWVTLERIADFPNYVPLPHPLVAGNIRLSNPFKLAVKDDTLYATDGGRNLIWRVDLPTRAVDTVASFPAIANPLFPNVGGPTMDAVPTGITVDGDSLLVSLFRGAPFAPGSSTVERVSRFASGGVHADPPYITGLKTAIGVLPEPVAAGAGLLVLQHASVGPFFNGPGLVLRQGTPPSAPTVVANCLTRPTAIARDRQSGRLYVSEVAGTVVTIDPAP